MWDCFIDAHYLDVQADPVPIVRRIYAHFAGYRGRRDRDASLARPGPRLACQRDATQLTLQRYGIDLGEIDEAMGPYVRQYGIQLER